MTTPHKIRPADHVRHNLTGESWVVLWADHETGYFAPAGWPPGQCKIEDVTLTKIATDDESREVLDCIEAALEGGERWTDGARALRLHRPERIPAGHVDQENPPAKAVEPHRFRTGDLVRFRSVGAIGGAALGDWKESMCVYADYDSGCLAPACAGDAWTIQISACELVTPATDEQHARVLDRFENLISKGINLEAGRRALEIHRPKAEKVERAMSAETRVLADIASHAASEGMRTVMRVARLASPQDSPTILHTAGCRILVSCAQAYAVQKTRDVGLALNPRDPLVIEHVRAIAAALALYPDENAMDECLAAGLGAVLLS